MIEIDSINYRVGDYKKILKILTYRFIGCKINLRMNRFMA